VGNLAEDPAGRRSRLRVLDSHLDALEAAQARGERAIPAAVCIRLQRDVPSVTQELSIPEAMELVYREQEHHLIGVRTVRPIDAIGAVGGTQASLAKRDARMLTDKIKKRLKGDVSLLLREAHTGRAWASLDYRSWEEYVRREFGLSRRRSYELLDHAQVMIAIGEAAGIADMPHIRPYTAIQLKPHLGQVCDAVRQAAASSPSDLAAAVDEVVHEWQDRAANERVAQRAQRSVSAKARESETIHGAALRLTSSTAWFDNAAIADLEAAIMYLANLPSPHADRAWQMQLSERTQLMAIPRALQWLSDASSILSVAQDVAVAAS
jgi:hypothetical protein